MSLTTEGEGEGEGAPGAPQVPERVFAFFEFWDIGKSCCAVSEQNIFGAISSSGINRGNSPFGFDEVHVPNV